MATSAVEEVETGAKPATSWHREWAGRAPAALRHWQQPAGALAFYFLVGLAILSPLASDVMPDTPAQDLANHVAGIIEARHALAEKQFPIRTAPSQCKGERYPAFQFYGNFPYTVGAVLYRAGFSPFAAYKVVLLLGLTAAGFCTYCCGREVTGAASPSLVAGAIYLLAPYMLTDIHARSAFTEAVAFQLLPVVLYCSLRAFSSRPHYVVLGGISWSCLTLTHNIAFLFASFFFCTYFLLHALWRGERWRGLLFVGAAYACGLVLSAWYVAPQLHVLHYLSVGQSDWRDNLRNTTWLTPLGVLLAPTLVLPKPMPVFDNPRFGLQIGWPLLAAFWLACRYAFSRQTPSPQRTSLVRLLILFGVALFLVWTPFNVWDYLPHVFSYTQFSYRLLIFCVLWGSLLAAHSLVLLFPTGMRSEHLVCAVLILGVCAAPYLSPYYTTTGQVSEAGELAHPNMGRGGGNDNYRMTEYGLSLCPNLENHPRESTVLTADQTRPLTRHGQPTRCHVTCSTSTVVQLPVLYYPGLLEVMDDGKRVHYGHLQDKLALTVSAGDHLLLVRFVGLRWANYLSAAGWIAAIFAFPLLKWSRRLQTITLFRGRQDT